MGVRLYYHVGNFCFEMFVPKKKKKSSTMTKYYVQVDDDQQFCSCSRCIVEPLNEDNKPGRKKNIIKDHCVFPYNLTHNEYSDKEHVLLIFYQIHRVAEEKSNLILVVFIRAEHKSRS